MSVLVLAMTTLAAPLTQGERDRVLSELHASRKQFLDAISGLTAAQWNFKADDKSWSIAECAEHIALSEDLIFSLATKKLMSNPAEPGRKPEIADETLLKMIVDRSQKMQAPETLRPTHRYTSQEALVAAFQKSRERSLDYVRDTQDELRLHSAKHPMAGSLDAYQWILLMSAHSERHTLQIEEVKANPNFPRP